MEISVELWLGGDGSLRLGEDGDVPASGQMAGVGCSLQPWLRVGWGGVGKGGNLR